MVGIVAIVGYSAFAGGGAWRGHLLLLAGAAMWAVYTLAFKRSGLSAIEAAAFVAVWSTIMLLPLGAPALVRVVAAGHALDVIVQAAVQGVLSGVLAIVLYGVAITRLGATRGAALTALVPVLAAILSVPLLGEWPGAATALAIVATTLGVALAAGALDGWRLGPQPGQFTAGMNRAIRILGIDPGLRRTGWGLIACEGNRLIVPGLRLGRDQREDARSPSVW